MYQYLASLLASTEELLACAEPSVADLQDYTLLRNQVFQRFQAMPTHRVDSAADSTGLQQLIISVLENDELLVQKIRHHLSKISRQMIELADGRRLFNAYVLGAQFPRSCHLHTA